MPVRQSYNVGTAASPGRLLTMPAWERGKALGAKLVTVIPKSGACGLPAFSSLYMLFDGNRSAARNDRWRNTH